MILASHLHDIRIRDDPRTLIYFHFLDTYLEGISDQRYRIKALVKQHTVIRNKIRNPDLTQEQLQEIHSALKQLFREIKVLFWWWNQVYTVIWKGEYIKFRKAYSPSLVSLLDKYGFETSVGNYKSRIFAYTGVRDDLEHILERIDQGKSDLGNLTSTNHNLVFTIVGKKIDISDDVLDLVDNLTIDINNWIKVPQNQ